MQPGGDFTFDNVRLPFIDKDQATRTWSVVCHRGLVQNILPYSEVIGPSRSGGPDVSTATLDGGGSLMLPSFCHSHIHLDKCFILEQCTDLLQGDFAEAMRVTKVVKAEFSKRPEDLYFRGSRIVRESVEYGVTSMRAHVEIDSSVGLACLEVAQRLQQDFRSHCDVQIAIFAQEPLFESVDHVRPGENFTLLKEAATLHGVSVIGSAPYVEPSILHAKMNISLIFDIADAQGIDCIDFHLDYNLDPSSEPLIYDIISQVRGRYQCGPSPADTDADTSSGTPNSILNNSISDGRLCPRITIGHATRLQLFSTEEWRELAQAISNLPITFIGLPQSDIYMQGRAYQDEPLGAPRGTLRVPYIGKKYGIEIAMSVNNVDNAFTPQGSLDPLSLCTFGVAIFQASTPEDIRTLTRSVTLTSKRAISDSREDSVPSDLVPNIGDHADFVILHKRFSLQSAVLNPPFERTTIKGGKVVASRRAVRWLAP